MARTADELASDLAAFIVDCLSLDRIEDVAARTGLSPERLYFLLETYTNESRVGLRLIAQHLSSDARILEVGCGIGALSSFLNSQGHQVTGIEPGAEGFGFMPALSTIVSEVAGNDAQSEFQPKEIDICDMTSDVHGQFDLIFSVHVIEHLADIDAAFKAMTDLLAPGGTMIHMCPNYTFFYEPHLGIPLVPGLPSATSMIFKKRVTANRNVWNSLNFVTASRIKSIALQNGLQVEFESSVMGKFLARLDSDSVFRERHSGVVTGLSYLAKRTGLMWLINRVPAALATPMIMRLTRLSQHVEQKI